MASGFGQKGVTERGKEIYLFKYTIYHALIKYSSGISPELYREDQGACDGHLGFTATVLYLFISIAFPKQATKLIPRCWQWLLLHPSLHQPAPSHLMVSVYNIIYALPWTSQPGLLSHLSCPQAAYCLNFDLYETWRKYSLSQRCANAVNDQSITLPCSGHVQLQRFCVGLNSAGSTALLTGRKGGSSNWQDQSLWNYSLLSSL